MELREKIEKEIQKHNKTLLSTSSCLTPYEVNQRTLDAILVEIKKDLPEKKEWNQATGRDGYKLTEGYNSYRTELIQRWGV